MAETDPQFAAFDRALAVGEAELAATVQRRKDQLDIGHAARTPDYQRAADTATESIGDDYEARGVYGSTKRVTDQGKAVGDVQRKAYQDLLGVNDQKSDLDMDLAMQVAANRRKAAETALSTASTTAISNARGVLGPLISGV